MLRGVFPETIPSYIVTLAERILSRGDSATAYKNDEKKVWNLMKQVVNTITSKVPGISASRVAMRNEIRALMISIEKGMPNFFITINPADVSIIYCRQIF